MESSLQQLRHTLRLHDLIKRKATGDPQTFADRMGFSRATLFRHLDGLRSLDADIDYDKERMSYFYKKQPDFSELKKILASLNDWDSTSGSLCRGLKKAIGQQVRNTVHASDSNP